jgi:hypothetical protein
MVHGQAGAVISGSSLMSDDQSQNFFVVRERAAQSKFFGRTVPTEAILGNTGYRLKATHRSLNLAPYIRDTADAYFGPPRNIAWHIHANHGLSSQVCCLNFLLPLAMNPRVLAKIVENALNLGPLKMLPVEDGPDGQPYYVGFEWIGREDYLGEWPADRAPKRGANVTSPDAFVRFEYRGQVQGLLIEWKYTEKYGQPLKPSGNCERIRRYKEKTFSPNGPIKPDLGLKIEDFFWEPFYQMMRQQMLAWRMARAREDDAERVSVLHISPSANQPLHKVTAPALVHFGKDAFDVFRRLLVQPDNFVSRTVEQVFCPTIWAEHTDPETAAWTEYLRDRYNFLSVTR